MVYIMTLLLITQSAHKKPFHKDKWFAMDKFMHMTYEFFAYGAVYHLAYCEAGLQKTEAQAVSIGFTVSLGIGKELLDKYWSKTYFSKKDLLADFVGIALGFLVFR